MSCARMVHILHAQLYQTSSSDISTLSWCMPARARIKLFKVPSSTAYVPVKTGTRFSAKARRPSSRSFVGSTWTTAQHFQITSNRKRFTY